MAMKILGISAFYHDSAASIVIDGKIIAAAQEERFTRIKHDANFPFHAITYCLQEAGLTINDLDAIAFYDKPFLKFERLLETFYNTAPKGFSQFVRAMPVWLKEKLFLKREIKKNLAELNNDVKLKKEIKILFPEHHLSHAASAFYPTNFEKAAILTIDGVGEWTTTSLCLGNSNEIKVLKEQHFPHSIGLLYSAFTYFLGFKVNSGEYKLMGLAPYGNNESEEVKKFEKLIKENVVAIHEDGSITMALEYFDFLHGLKMINQPKWEKLFGMSLRNGESELTQQQCNLGLAIQNVTEEIVIKLAKAAKQLTGADALCLAGGVALNCVANGKLQAQNIFKDVYIQPAAGDAGGALGAALAANYIFYKQARVVGNEYDNMQGSYLGPEFSTKEIERGVKKYNASYTLCDTFTEVAKNTAEYLAEGNVIGWFQGRMEFGPRALGARSIIADARNEEMQKKLNLKIKYREGFRPFAPSVLAEEVSKWFNYNGYSPYMLLVHSVSDSIKNPLPAGYSSFALKDKLYFKRSSLPSITHVDYSARIQTVHKNTNPRYYELIDQFKTLTGAGVIVNTSFNVRGEPIVCTPEDAYKCFMRTEMDYLVLGNCIFKKADQPKWEENADWKQEYQLD